MVRVTKVKVVVGTEREERCEILRGSELTEPCNTHNAEEKQKGRISGLGEWRDESKDLSGLAGEGP